MHSFGDVRVFVFDHLCCNGRVDASGGDGYTERSLWFGAVLVVLAEVLAVSDDYTTVY